MRRSLEKTIEGYNRLAKTDIRTKASDPERTGIEDALHWYITDSTERQRSKPEAQEQIYALQKQKQTVMDQLHAAFSRLDTPAEQNIWPKGSRLTTFEQGQLKFKNQSIDLATLITDAEWGIYYRLPPSTPKHLRKRYILELTKIKLSQALNSQIIIDETSNKTTDMLKKEAYVSVREMDEQKRRFEQGGFIAEIMVKNFLTKLSERFDFDFEIIPSDVYDDVENKIDFIIRRKKCWRGVRVEESEEVSKDVGVQFTINTDPGIRIHKEKQLQKVRSRLDSKEMPIEDIVLVQMYFGSPKKAYDEWKKAGSPPGGPDGQWPPDTQRKIFFGTMQNIFSPAELEAQWSIIERTLQKTNTQTQQPESKNVPRNPFKPSQPSVG